MTSGKSFIAAFGSSAPRQPIDPVGQARSACSACRRSSLDLGWNLTKDVSVASPKVEGAIWRQASQSMQVESTKKSPGTFSGTRFFRFAMIEPPCALYALRFRRGVWEDGDDEAIGPVACRTRHAVLTFPCYTWTRRMSFC